MFTLRSGSCRCEGYVQVLAAKYASIFARIWEKLFSPTPMSQQNQLSCVFLFFSVAPVEFARVREASW